jgi:DNA polymerase-3 subunit delta
VRKLALYAQNNGQVTLDDVLAVVADASVLALDNVVDAAFAGKTTEVETQYGKARLAGTAPGTIALAALRQVSNLHRLRLAVDEGSSVSEAVARARPPVHFRRQAIVEAALRNWTSEKLAARDGAIVGSRVRQRAAAGARRVDRASRALASIAVNARQKSS